MELKGDTNMSAPSHTAKTYAPAGGGAPAPSTGDFAVYADDGGCGINGLRVDRQARDLTDA
jgi:hypothetical protein